MPFSLRICAGRHAGREIPIRGPRFLIGCADNCDLKIHAARVTPYHCELLVKDEGLWVRDHGGGTTVGGTPIVERRRLNPGDHLQVGALQFELLVQAAPMTGNDSLPDEREILEILSQQAARPAAPPAEQENLSSAKPSDVQASSAELVDSTATADFASDALNKIYKSKATFKNLPPVRAGVAPAISAPEEVDAVSITEGPQATFVAGASAAAPTRRVIALPRWLFTAEGRLDPNAMFVLGIWVGIGLCSAAVTFFRIFVG